MIFNGKTFAQKIEEDLKQRVSVLPKKPKLVAILDPAHAGSVMYTNLKEKFAQRIGVDFLRLETLNPNIETLNTDESVTGIIIQLPFPDSQKYISLVNKNKDVDGLRLDSPYKPAAVRASLVILNEVKNPDLDPSALPQDDKIVVVGSHGVIGKKLMQQFNCLGFDKEDFNPSALLRASVVISATGVAGLIKPEMVKDGVIAIDLGYPMGDFDPAVTKKASFFTPVPGGVGPVTVACLFKNLLDSLYV